MIPLSENATDIIMQVQGINKAPESGIFKLGAIMNIIYDLKFLLDDDPDILSENDIAVIHALMTRSMLNY